MTRTTQEKEQNVQWPLFKHLDNIEFADAAALLSHGNDKMENEMTALGTFSSRLGPCFSKDLEDEVADIRHLCLHAGSVPQLSLCLSKDIENETKTRHLCLRLGLCFSNAHTRTTRANQFNTSGIKGQPSDLVERSVSLPRCYFKQRRNRHITSRPG